MLIVAKGNPLSQALIDRAAQECVQDTSLNKLHTAFFFCILFIYLFSFYRYSTKQHTNRNIQTLQNLQQLPKIN